MHQHRQCSVKYAVNTTAIFESPRTDDHASNQISQRGQVMILPLLFTHIYTCLYDRLVGRFNLTHTIRDIRYFIELNTSDSLYSGTASPSYILQTPTPHNMRVLSNSDETIKEGNLAQATVIVRPLE